MFRRSRGNKPLDSEWHEKRQEARKTAFSLAEFSQEEITRYDLDTARITGRDNPRTYEMDPAIDLLGTAKKDIRKMGDR